MFYPQKFNEGLQMQLGNAALLKVAGEISNEEFDSYCEQMVKEAAGVQWLPKIFSGAKRLGQNIIGSTKNIATDAKSLFNRGNFAQAQRNLHGANLQQAFNGGATFGQRLGTFAQQHKTFLGGTGLFAGGYTAGRLMSPSVPQPQAMSQPQFYPQTMQ